MRVNHGAFGEAVEVEHERNGFGAVRGRRGEKVFTGLSIDLNGAMFGIERADFACSTSR
jgi:hypothetical protein